MTTPQPPTNVPDLLAHVAARTGNIAKLRKDITKAAADAAAKVPQPPQGEVTT